MKRLFIRGSSFFVALVFLFFGSTPVWAALTFDATSITTDGAFTLNGVAGSAYAIGGSTVAGTITIGGTAQTGLLTLGQSSGTNTIAIGSGTGATTVQIATGATNAKTVQIGTGAVANTITIGSAATTGLSLTDDNWNITAAGVGTFDSLVLNGTTDITSETNEALTITPNGTGDISLSVDGDSEVGITASAAPTADMVTITNAGQGTVTNGVDALAINLVTAAVAGNRDHSGLDITVDQAGATEAGDTIQGINIAALGVNPTGLANAIEIGANWDNALLIGANDIEGTDATITFTDFTLAAEGRIAMNPDTAGDAITITSAAGASEAISIDSTADVTDPDGVIDMDVDVNSVPGQNVEGINLDFELVTGGTGNVSETHSAFLITATQNSSDEANDDVFYGINIANMGGTARDGVEAAIAIGDSWDRNLLFLDASTSIGISDAGTFTFENASGTDFFTAAAGTFTVTGALNPEAAGTRDLGLTTAEWDQIYLADDGGLELGLDQDATLAYDEVGDATGDRVELTGTNASLWLEDRLSLGIQTVTIADDGNGGTSPTDTTAPTTAFVQVVCNDAQGCNYTFAESSAKVGDLLIIVNNSVNSVVITDTVDQINASAATVTLGTDDTIMFIYSDQANDEWVQLGTSNN
ncbi:hypothetical protein HYW94_03280 [Candidatus Uhrbacteria bacterium]|nr:hypothetical protein [Candidatus Uhrbacteria bacterium]